MKKLKLIVKNVPKKLTGYVESALEGLHYPSITTFRGTVTAATYATKDAYECLAVIEPLLKSKNLDYTVRVD